MKPSGNGVAYYTRGIATIPVYFVEDHTTCNWCRYAKNEDSLKRHKCMLTDEYLLYPFTSRGNECPIVFEDEGDESTL